MKPSYVRSKSKGANALIPCKKHPKHRQSPGVCSVCLNEKLLQLNHHNFCSKAGKTQLSSSFSSYDLSSLSSSCSSPVVFNYRRSNTRAFKNIVYDQEMFKKSRSMAFVFQRKKDDQNRKNVETKRGFWWRLRRTTRERIITAVH
ncbi:hypothetical protein PHJA_001632100 [Phtheirospermum japonicum]|uniref:Uncharacterized protein n=1 Tax=Phtheirospermum japonicum TaxID=374723 RepID=A0A830C2J6_9LAMI|nr:hypothetical protein PHJA_001632100 [Phtheirospermum japonicum]